MRSDFFYLTSTRTYNLNGNIKYQAYNTNPLQLDYVFNSEGYFRYYGPTEHYPFYYIKDHLGNIRETYVYPEPNYKECVQRMQYYPSSLPWNENVTASEQPYKYNSKEFVEMHGLDEYDSEARWYYPALMRTTTIDPLAEKYPDISPYAWCGNNIVNKIDLDGKADFWANGKVIGNDGIDDKKVYVLKTTETEFENGVKGAGISKGDYKATVNFIKTNSGNATAFQNNNLVWENTIEIEGSSVNREMMMNEVSKDNGRGGTLDANNREYGGTIQSGLVVMAEPGAVANPQIHMNAQIELPIDVSTFHSHPSGTRTEDIVTNTIGGTRVTYSFSQSPSPADINVAGTQIHYVFARGEGKVYVYTSRGVQAVIPNRYFVIPRR